MTCFGNPDRLEDCIGNDHFSDCPKHKSCIEWIVGILADEGSMTEKYIIDDNKHVYRPTRLGLARRKNLLELLWQEVDFDAVREESI